MANKLKGEVSVKIGSQKYKLRPSFAAIQGLEAELGSLISLVDRIAKGNVTIHEVATIIQYGIAGANPNKELVNLEELGEAVYQAGFMTLLSQTDERTGEAVFPTFLMNALTGGKGIAPPIEEGPEAEGKPQTRKNKQNSA